MPAKLRNAPFARVFDGTAGGWRLLLVCLWMFAFGVVELPVLARMGAHGAGILDFEFAASTHRASEILALWGPVGRTSAEEHGFMDFGFILGYGLLISGGCSRVAARYGRLGDTRRATIAAVLAWAALAGATANTLQKIALWLELHGHTGQPLPAFAATCAVSTFALAGPGALFAIGGAIRTRRLSYREARRSATQSQRPARHRTPPTE